MMKFFTKKSCLTLFISCGTLLANAQVGFNYSRYDLGIGTSFNQVFGDTYTSPVTESVNFTFTYNQTPFTNLVLEADYGKLKGGYGSSSVKKEFNSTFSTYVLREQLQLGELIDYSRSPIANAAKNAYISLGLGYIVNQVTSINRDNIYGKYAPGQNDIQVPFIPIRIGYEFKVLNQYNEPSFKIDLGYQYNLIFSDNVDGYTSGKGNDIFTQLAIGIKFAVGGTTTSYRKQIQYQ